MSNVIQGFGFTVTELGLIDSLNGQVVQQSSPNCPPLIYTPQAYSSRCTINATGQSQIFQWFGSGFPGFDFDGQGAANQMAFDYGRQNAGI